MAVVLRDKILEPEARVCFVLSSYGVEPVRPGVFIFNILTLTHFLESIKIVVGCTRIGYFLPCPLFVFVYPNTFLTLPDRLRGQGEIIFSKVLPTLRFHLAKFITAKHDA